jgi:serine-type D-Ala-D-Ala carboxypeptidase/endopeptidase (penicillin-binding protein 4)
MSCTRIPVHPIATARFPLLTALTLLLSACASAAPAPAPRQTAATLAASIDSIVQAPPLHRTAWGILLQDAASGTVLYSRNPQQLFIPASNMKLMVATTALGRLGPDWRYRTELLAGGRAGNHAEVVFVAGAGDPTWSVRFYDDVAAPFDSMAAIVAVAGIRTVGTLVLDLSRFRHEPIHPTWEVSDLPGVFAPPVEAFAAAEGTFRLALTGGLVPGSAGTAAVVAPLRQPVHATVITDTAGARAAVSVDFLARRDTIYLTARVGAGAADTLTLAVTRPAESAAAALVTALQRWGVSADGVRLVRDSSDAEAMRQGLVHLGALTSAPMSRTVAATLQPSQNWISEQVLKTLGAEFAGEGSWRAGNEVVRRYLVDEVGIDSTAFLLRDASGMSAQNLMTPTAAVAMLGHGARLWGAEWRAAMAQPGLSGTTLAGRLLPLEGRVFAKTGTITNVNSLSGHFIAADGREYLFSILSNASGVPAAAVRAAIDDVVLTMARHLDAR